MGVSRIRDYQILHRKVEKMRLIDAENLVNKINAGNYCDDLGQIVHSIGEKEVNEAPTVEAIPIDWLQKKMTEYVIGGKYSSDRLPIVYSLISDWKKENAGD